MIKLRIKIRTPKGQAPGAEKKITPILLGLNRKQVKVESYCSPEEDEIVWEIEGPVRRLAKISRNASRFDIVIRMMLDNKMVKKTVRSHLSQDDETELSDMLLNHTTCEVVQEATAEEIAESQISWWQRVKNTYHKNPLP